MDDDRLQALLLCSIETDLFDELTDEELIDSILKCFTFARRTQ
jgi:hypothetical protein